MNDGPARDEGPGPGGRSVDWPDHAWPIPRGGRHAANGTTLYAEVRGEGPAVLLIPGGAEDADGWRPVAERLPGRTVVTYDRRGTRRSGRDDWPGRGSAQHADDAAALLHRLGLRDVTVFGGSSGGIIALRLALRHPEPVHRVLVYEPGFLRCVPEGERIRRLAVAAIEAHLLGHPSDWAGAYHAVTALVSAVLSPGPAGFLAPPAGMEWYAEREAGNAEPFVRDDVPLLTAESVDGEAIGSAAVELRFVHGTSSPVVFRDITARSASLYGQSPDVIEGVGHVIYLSPDAAARYILDHSG